MIPDTNEQKENKDQQDNVGKETFTEEYEYENEEPEITETNSNKTANDKKPFGQSGNSEFGSRIKSGK